MCMLKCSFAATVLNPGTFLAFIMAPFLFLYFVVAYIVMGTPLFYLLRKKTWGIHIIAAWLIINVILTSVLTYLLFIIETGNKIERVKSNVDSILGERPLSTLLFTLFTLH